jgi:hypothetical protein
MPYSKLNYPSQDLSTQSSLNELFAQLIEASKDKSFPYDRTSDDIVLDGIYPNYSNQQVKVLFIGRESLGLTGENYVDLMHHAYKVDKKIGSKTINQHSLHKLKLSIAYGLNNNNCPWEDIPSANEIADSFAEEHGISFAFMNLSKLSNESEDWKVDWELVDGYLNAFKDSPINFFAKQIDIINPDIILTMNIEGRLSALGNLTPIEYEDNASYHTLTTGENNYYLIDLYHFSAIGKSPKECFYEPILKYL